MWQRKLFYLLAVANMMLQNGLAGLDALQARLFLGAF